MKPRKRRPPVLAQQLSVPIGSGSAGMTVTTDELNTAPLNPKLAMTRFVVP